LVNPVSLTLATLVLVSLAVASTLYARRLRRYDSERAAAMLNRLRERADGDDPNPAA